MYAQLSQLSSWQGKNTNTRAPRTSQLHLASLFPTDFLHLILVFLLGVLMDTRYIRALENLRIWLEFLPACCNTSATHNTLAHRLFSPFVHRFLSSSELSSSSPRYSLPTVSVITVFSHPPYHYAVIMCAKLGHSFPSFFPLYRVFGRH